ncbi:MAG: metal ABC transporter ATP-binding protein [bacterium]|nr:metal ABC transporter ATP-binding protein [bacterium]MDT8365018.1 metal ABC transporter ATP-binding protein [bacterium]
MTEPDVLFDLDEVSFRYGNEQILDSVSMKVHRGDFLALLGPNGSGKSTLIRIILGLQKPDSGLVRIMGRNLGDFTAWDRVGYVPQKVTDLDPLFPASVKEVVAMGLLPHKAWPRFLKPGDEAVIDEALDLMDMRRYKNRRIWALSGGQQQRVFIARALASQPEILVLDEPTTGVDGVTQERFYDMLEHINREKGVTLILVTHDIGVVTKHVNKVACLNQRLIFHGSHDDFCDSEQAITLFGPESHLICHRH